MVGFTSSEFQRREKERRWTDGQAAPLCPTIQSLPCSLAIWLARNLRRGRLGGHLAIKPVEKILFDDRKLRAADRVDVVLMGSKA